MGNEDARLRTSLVDVLDRVEMPADVRAGLKAGLAGLSGDQLRFLVHELRWRQRFTFDEIAAHYAARGLEVSPPAGNCDFGRTMVCCPHDGVPYCMDAHPTQSEPDWDHGIRHRELLIERHHDTIKAVHEHCARAGVGDVWVLSGGGAQLQAFFGNRDGYLGILYLTLVDDPHLRPGECVFDVQWSENNRLFEDMVVPGVEVIASDVPARARLAGDRKELVSGMAGTARKDAGESGRAP